jgi:mannose-1-phosphate guanylyltransferase
LNVHRRSEKQDIPAVRDVRRVWAIILAGGAGSRVRSFTTGACGEYVPKQFCSFGTGACLLRRAIDRAAGVVSRRHIVAVVAKDHRRWWADELSDLPAANIVAQPQNKGTACGLLLPLICILQRDRMAQVVVIPSDHFVENEPRLREAVLDAVLAADEDDGRVVLLGITPREGDSEYGWIVPATGKHVWDDSVQRVETFVEKPDGERARSLMERGAVLNSFIFVGSGAALLGLYHRAAPHLPAWFAGWKADAPDGPSRLEALYENLPNCDFSRDILEHSCDRLWLVRAGDCGWVDLGTPERLRSFQGSHVAVPAFRRTESELPVTVS